MRVVLILFWIMSLLVGAFAQIRYAKANYPSTGLWKLKLFGSGFASGTFGAWAIFYSLSWSELLFAILLMGLFSALLSTYAFPRNMQGWYPKRDR